MPEETATLDEHAMNEEQPGQEGQTPEPGHAEIPAADAEKREDAGEATPPPPPEPPVAEDSKPEPPAPSNKRWYVVKVQSGREESIKDAIERRVKIEGLEDHFGQIIIPVEKVTEMRNGKRVVRERKLYPGYLMVEVEYNDRILYLFRETSGVGDFVGGSLHHAPPPMSDREVERMRGSQGQHVPGIAHTKPKYDRGDRVKVKDGTFAGMEGEVKDLLEAKGLVRVELTIFGRPVPVELEYWQVEHI
ncbi:MAG TPA: transcription termination/antitermination protein NusG [Gemmataceae bacterium]|jgi:transcriptional antiterminator NusG|nr:transcription termination/antitermination protein NusG [Gemmataceae bacterium]